MSSTLADRDNQTTTQEATASNTATRAADFAAGGADLSEHLSTCMCAACMNADDVRDDVDADDADSAGGVSSGEPTAAGAGATATLAQMAAFLEEGYWGNGVGSRHNVGSTGLDANNGVLHYNVSGFGPLTYGGGSDVDGVSAARAALIRDAFDVYSAVLGIDFVETTGTDDSEVDFFFSDNSSGAYAGSTRYSDGTIYYSYINIAQNWSGSSSTYDDYTLQTIFHEIGHALGLGHQGSYNGSASYDNDALFTLDSWQASMMSYFSQSQNTAIDASREFLQTPMAVDWLALDSIYAGFGYGVSNAFLGDTVYGFNTNISAQESAIWNAFSDFADRTASTIIDAGGIDTLDVSGYGADQKIDLSVQEASQTFQDTSDIGGRIGNLTLAVGTVIENAIGGSGNDILIGNSSDNILRGGAGDDIFTGFSGNDTFHGESGFDCVIFSNLFSSFTFALLENAIEVIGEGIDLVYDTIESLQFSDVTYSFATIMELYGNASPLGVDDFGRVFEDDALTLDVLQNDSDPDGDALSITAINGQDIDVGGSVTLASGASLTLNADGTLDYAQNGVFSALDAAETAQDTFTYSLADGAGGSATADVAVTIDGVSPASNTAIGQSGTVTIMQDNSEQWHRVTFDAVIENAVVVMGPMTFNGGNPGTTRVRDVSDTGFEFQIDEWNYLDGFHITESIGWLAISEGSHILDGGQTVVAGNASVATDFADVDFGGPLENAVVLAEITSVNEVDAATTRIRQVTDTGFKVRVQEEEAQGAHGSETVSWIAFEQGAGVGIEAVVTPNQLDHRADSFVFNTPFDSAPVLLADMQSTNGGDTATVRMKMLNDTGVSLFVEEEKSRDTETGHINEIAGYVALEEGLIFDNFAIG